jgi:hypothetical protein
MSDTSCSGLFIEQVGATGNYRYFNQPVEQIPGWDPEEFQFLFHSKNQGLSWQSLPTGCIDVVTCIKLNTETNKLDIERKTLVVLRVDDSTSTACSGIDITSCS